MKYQPVLAVFIFLLCGSIQAKDLSFAFEGNDDLRSRLEKLQGSSEIPELKLRNWMNASAMTLEDLKGKIVVLDFWATWCGPCIRSIPKNNELAERFKDDIVIIGICAEKGSERMQAVVEERGIKYPVAIDEDDQTNEAYDANGYPDYYIIDKTGKLVVADCKNSQVSTVIEMLLAEEK
jgi:thiol-disulfide isomerase/thioredoxin